MQKLVDGLLLSIHSFGFSVDLPPHLKQTNARKATTLTRTASMNGPHQQLMAITESLKAFAASIEMVAYDQARNHQKSEAALEAGMKKPVLSKEYLGVSNGSMVSEREDSEGYTLRWWNSLHFKITNDLSVDGVIHATITESNLRKESSCPTDQKTVNGHDMAPDHPLYRWAKDLLVRVSLFTGTYTADTFLLSGTAHRISEEVSGVLKESFQPMSHTYHLVLRPTELTGVQFGKTSVSGMILTQIV